MADVTQGPANVSDIASAVSRGTTTFDRRRIFNFGERVAALKPQDTPFFVYTSRLRKATTDSSEFKVLEDRAAVQYTGRTFQLDGAHDISSQSEGDTFEFTVDDGATTPSPVEWLLKGMVFAIGLTDASAGNPEHVHVRIVDDPTHSSSDSSFLGRITKDPTSSIGDHSSNDDTECQVIGTAFQERSGSPDVWTEGMVDEYGQCQIFKTALDMSWRALTEKFRGTNNEWMRQWGHKTNEHKVDIERSLLFGQKGTQNGITYTDGIVGMIQREATPVTSDATDLSYTERKPYMRQIDLDDMSYDRFLSDLEVITDPARGGSRDKLALCGRPVLTWFNQLGSTSFLGNSLAFSNSPHSTNFEMEKRTGAFGHDITTLHFKYARVHLVEEPLFRGIYDHYMALIDLANVRYRPLANNGYNWDTVVVTDVQTNDESAKKDMLYTDAGLEITLPETHMLYSFDRS